MSDNMTEQERQDAIARNTAALNSGSIKLDEYNKRMEALKTSTERLSDGFKALGTSAVGLAGSLKDGDQRAQAYNGVVKSAADTVATFASRLGPVGAVFGTIVKAGASYAQAVNKQADAVYKGYQDISRLGATGSSGLTGVYDNMKKLGYGVGELSNMQGLLAESATTLASLSGTVAEGTQNISNVSRQIRDSDIGNKFLTMGISVDGMNKGIVSYLRIQTQVGRAQQMTAEQLKAGAAAYIESADKLTKITGLGLQEQQAVEQRALSEDMFGAYADRMQKEGRGAEVEQIMTITKMLAAQGAGGESVAQGVRDIKSGAIQTDAAQALMRSNADIVGIIQKQGVSADEIAKSLTDGGQKLRDDMGRSREIIGSAGFLKQSELQAIDQAFKTKGGKSVSERLAEAAIDQGVTDKPTKNLTDLATSGRQTRDSLQDLVQRGIEPVTTTMAALAKVTAKAAGIPGDVLGKSMGGGYVGRGSGGFLGGGPKGGPIDTSSSKSLLDKIGQHESGGNYNAVVGDAKQNKIDFSKMTIAQVQDYQSKMRGQGKESSAVGKYQFIQKTLAGVTKQAGFDPNTTMFTPEVQDQLATQLLKNRGLDKLKAGQISERTFATNISKEWASLPKDESNRGYYDGVGSNKALTTYDAVLNTIRNDVGPTSGRQSVKLPDASQVVGTRTDPTDFRSPAAIAADQRHQEFVAMQLAQQSEANDIARQQLRVQQKTNAKIS